MATSKTVSKALVQPQLKEIRGLVAMARQKLSEGDSEESKRVIVEAMIKIEKLIDYVE